MTAGRSGEPGRSADAPMPGAGDYDACLAAPVQHIATPSGVIEYAQRGEGLPLLSLHGSPGGWAAGLLPAEVFRLAGFRVIAPSRHGYGGTPLSTGRSWQGQAAAMVALLDHLGIERAAVFAISGGGPLGFMLAARYPDRVSCLLQVSAVTLPLPPSRPERLAVSLRPIVDLQLLLLDRAPGLVRCFAGAQEAVDPAREAAQIALLRNSVLSVQDWPRRRVGYYNDDARFAVMTLPLADVRCPTLLIHGTSDRTVPVAHAEHARARIPGSVLMLMPRAGHLGFFVRERAQRAAARWAAARAA